MIHVITWHYSDKSGFGVIRAYGNLDDATKDFEMLKQHADTKNFEIVEVEFMNEYPE